MTLETTIRRLIDRHRLTHIDTGTNDGVTYIASAYPKCWSEPIRHATADTVEGAIAALAKALATETAK